MPLTLPLAVLLALMLALAVGVAAPPLLWLLARMVTGRVAQRWGGHDIEGIQRVAYRELLVDGVCVARGRSPRLQGVLSHASLGAVPVIFASDGQQSALFVGGERICGELSDAEALAASRVTEPDDPRWPAARALLDSLGESRDPEVRKGTAAVGAGLRDALRHLAVLDRTAQAHAALGGDTELAAARATLHAEVDRWIEALRALHLQATVRAGSPADALAQIRAEGEVDAVVRRRARALAERAGQG